MYVSTQLPAVAAAVWMMRGPIELPEWQRHLADMLAIRTPTPAPRPAVLLDVEGFVPTAVQRAQLAEHSRHPDYRPYLAFVTQSGLARSALRAIHWLQSEQHYDTGFFASRDEAIAWLEAKRGEPLTELRAAHDRLLRATPR